MKSIIDKLERENRLSREEWTELFASRTRDDELYARDRARIVCESVYGRHVYLRGLIEISSYCKNDCLYCGLRRSNARCERYRLTKAEILECCREGAALGFSTFVLQGGEDGWFTDGRLVEIVSAIRSEFPNNAITLSLGERSAESYRRLRQAGADRYLLRHETADAEHYSILHPPELRLDKRMECLRTLKALGYQTGAGVMVGSPGQSAATIAADMEFMADLQPHMVGIGPFLPHHATPFRAMPAGDLNDTLFLVALARLMLPKALIPATTALATLSATGREDGLLSGANVIMPNLSPEGVRGKYLLYDGKRAFGSEAAQALDNIRRTLSTIGRDAVMSRGDHISLQ